MNKAKVGMTVMVLLFGAVMVGAMTASAEAPEMEEPPTLVATGGDPPPPPPPEGGQGGGGPPAPMAHA